MFWNTTFHGFKQLSFFLWANLNYSSCNICKKNCWVFVRILLWLIIINHFESYYYKGVASENLKLIIMFKLLEFFFLCCVLLTHFYYSFSIFVIIYDFVNYKFKRFLKVWDFYPLTKIQSFATYYFKNTLVHSITK